MKYLFTLLLAAVFSSAAFSQSEVKIGNQVWMSKNLDVSTYRNGESIRYASTQEEWTDAAKKGEGAWCYYNHDPNNGKIYGKLYNWYCVADSRGLAPIGYHVPSDAEWTILTDFLGGEEIAGKKMKSVSGWYNGGNGDNSSRFNGLPGGFYNYNGNFFNVTGNGHWWSSSESSTGNARNRGLYYANARLYRSYDFKSSGISVRCIKD